MHGVHTMQWYYVGQGLKVPVVLAVGRQGQAAEIVGWKQAGKLRGLRGCMLPEKDCSER